MKNDLSKEFTEETYDKAARGYAEKFKNIGVRAKDVDKAFTFVAKENPSVVEIGCGAGREAEYIFTKTNRYIGMDISAGMLEVARENFPDVHFVQADIDTYKFPEGVDIVFAFASLLHSSKESLVGIFNRIYDALNEDGVVYVSLKRRDKYSSAVVEDTYGPREFYYYTKETLLEVAGDHFDEVFYEEQERIEPWFTMILKKK